MDTNTITIEKDKLEQYLYETVKEERRLFYELCYDDYLYLPAYERTQHKGMRAIIIQEKDWENYLEAVSECLGDLLTARELVKSMQSVYDEFYREYEKRHNFSFDKYMKMQVASYDTEDFEKVRERFENEFYKNEEDDIEL